jgi:hypothetical protein
MTDEEPGRDQGPQHNEDSYSPRSVLIGLIVVLGLVVGGLILVYELRDMARVQDCVMQGRTNCSPVDSGRPGN